jgi:DNA methylase
MKVIHANCLDYIDKLPQEVFLISDPPYNRRYHYDEYKDGLPRNEYRSLLFDVFKGKKAVIILYPEDTIEYLGGGNFGEPQEVVSWVYNSNTCKQSRLVSWWNCKPDFRRIRQPYKNPLDKRVADRAANGRMARAYDWWAIHQVKNVSKKYNPHPCPVPYELASRIIISTLPERATVCDPFCGSGTILKAAQDLGHKVIGFDMSATYCDYANSTLR